MPTHDASPGLEARLALADGTVVSGPAFGAVGRGIVSVAEVVFNTAMSGYQESITDPSYTGQILVATFPMIGNTGVNREDEESPKIQVAGLVVRELARRHSNYRAQEDLASYLGRHGVLGISGIDTRALTLRLRSAGVLMGVLTDRSDLSDDRLVELARSAPGMTGQNLVGMVGCSARRAWDQDLGDWTWSERAQGNGGPRVLALDCGAKANILRNLTDRGCRVTLAPHSTGAEEIRRLYDAGEIDGVFISNGPGDPQAVSDVIKTLSTLLAPQYPPIPMFGICLGHQLIGLAVGGKAYKLKFGHRGINQPVRHAETGRVEITSQNHGFAIDTESVVAAGGIPTHVHLNDGTLAGFRLRDRPVFCVQHHPEASPGPHDAGYLFDAFIASMASARREPRAGAGSSGTTRP
ncbi:MAG: glutamine-hydrolyzing carbamoyl-phosphate synthase small subunit [Phycisphaeraceae bacterium]|nr:glutamine-hydrolyzing carbamoyl-phosphate synthase small subunit [Phycisphaerae bacterium]MBX3392454.1 glutamine-hydrolyzing carbamoyl-phosphate synthase small subunit [Phycisphaeraceae bacterium]